jgi:hypothetical protein
LVEFEQLVGRRGGRGFGRVRVGVGIGVGRGLSAASKSDGGYSRQDQDSGLSHSNLSPFVSDIKKTQKPVGFRVGKPPSVPKSSLLRIVLTLPQDIVKFFSA